MKIFDPKCRLVFYVDSIAYTIEDLDMEFDIKLTSTSDANIAKITVYNLSESTRNMLGSRFQKVEFHAGYENNPVLIFMGQIMNVESEKVGVNWATYIYAADGIKEWASIHFNKSYKKGTGIKTILEDLAKATGMRYLLDIKDLPDTLCLSGETYCGKVKDILKKLCEEYDCEAFILHGYLIIKIVGGPGFIDDEIPIIGPYTGMIGSPSLSIFTVQETVKLNLSKKKLKAKKQGKKVKEEEKENRHRIAVKVKSALIPQLKPSALVYISTKQKIYVNSEDEYKQKNIHKKLDGLYVIYSVAFSGDNFGGDFYSEVEAILPLEDNAYYNSIKRKFDAELI